MRLIQWFKSKVGKKVIADHPETGRGTIVVKDEKHAEKLYDAQTKNDYVFHDHDQDNEEHDSITPIVAGVLAYEILSAADSDTDSVSTPAVDNFGGGQTDGAGAGGSWEPDTSVSDSVPDSSPSYDSGSSMDTSSIGGSEF